MLWQWVNSTEEVDTCFSLPPHVWWCRTWDVSELCPSSPSSLDQDQGGEDHTQPALIHFLFPIGMSDTPILATYSRYGPAWQHTSDCVSVNNVCTQRWHMKMPARVDWAACWWNIRTRYRMNMCLCIIECYYHSNTYKYNINTIHMNLSLNVALPLSCQKKACIVCDHNWK